MYKKEVNLMVDITQVLGVIK